MKLPPDKMTELKPFVDRMQQMSDQLDEADRCLQQNANEIPVELIIDHIKFLETFNTRNQASVEAVTKWDDPVSLELLSIFETRISRANDMLTFWRNHVSLRVS